MILPDVATAGCPVSGAAYDEPTPAGPGKLVDRLRDECFASGAQALTGALDEIGWPYLPHPCRSSTRSCDIDFVLVHPGGVFVLDAKAWPEASLRGDRLYRGRHDETDAVVAALGHAQEIERDLTSAGFALLDVHPVVVFTRYTIGPARLGRVVLTDIDCLGELVRSYGTRLDTLGRARALEQIESPWRSPARLEAASRPELTRCPPASLVERLEA